MITRFLSSLIGRRSSRPGLMATAMVGAVSALMAAAPASAQDPKQEVSILLDWFVNPDHAALVIAQEKGYFADEGLDVTLTAPADPNDPPKLVAAGQADLAVSYQPQLHLLVDAGLPLSRVGTLVATPLNSLVVTQDGEVQELADLKGRKVGYSVGGFEDALLGTMLESVGLSLDDVELINVEFSLSPSLYAGQVDAVIGAFRNFELNQMDIADKPGKAFYPEEHGVPPYDELILVAANNTVGTLPLGKVMRALEKATIFSINHPDEAWALFITAYPDLDDELNRRAWLDTLPRLALRPAALDAGRYARFAAYLEGRGMISTPPAVEAYTATVQ